MTGNKCLLDTSVIIHVFKKNNAVAEKLDAMQEIYVPVEVVGELYYGAYRSSNPAKHISQVQTFLTNCNILSADKITADIYGNIKATLTGKGKPIPENDLWIAAIAQQHRIPLFTTDGHFKEIIGISFVE